METLFYFLSSDLHKFIPWVLTNLCMLVLAFDIFLDDMTKMSIKLYKLLLFVLVGYVGSLLARVISGCFEWYYLLPIPVYILLNMLNTLLNSNKIIGKADVDILAGSLALSVPIFIAKATENYDGEFLVNQIHISGFVGEMFVWILLGYIIAIFIALFRWFILGSIYNLIKNRKIEKNKEDINDIKEESLDKNNKRKTKVPVAVAFMPLFFYMVYVVSYYPFN